MNLKFIEGGKAGHKVIKFRGVGVANEKVVYGKGEKGGGVGMVAKEHRGGGFGVAVLGEKRDKAKLG